MSAGTWSTAGGAIGDRGRDGGDRGATVLVIQHEADAGPGLLGDALLAAGLRVDVWCAEDGASLPRQLGFYAGLAVLGGRMSANDTADFPYLEAVKDLIRDAAGRRVPALGICLGAQLAAAALGGRVMPRPAGPRIGWRAAVGTSRADSLTAGLDNGAQLFCWHGDCYEPPSGAVPLLEDWDAFRVGSVCAFQPHPEVTAAIIQAWCSSDVATNQLARAGTTAGLVMEDSAIHERHGLEILERWCLEVSSCAASSE